VWLARAFAYWLSGAHGPWRAVGPDDDEGGS
jgi:hypothetical protein